MRPKFLSDPAQPEAGVDDQVWWPLDDIKGWADELVDGIITTELVRAEIGGRGAASSRNRVGDRAVRGGRAEPEP